MSEWEHEREREKERNRNREKDTENKAGIERKKRTGVAGAFNGRLVEMSDC